MSKNEAERLSSIHNDAVDWKTRTVWIVGPLEDEKSYKLVPLLRLLDETPGPVRVVIMSPGGGEAGGRALFDTIKLMKNEVLTYGFGAVYSIAAMLFQAGKFRYLAPHAELMMHNGTLNLEGELETDKIEDLASEAIRSNTRYQKIIAERCGIELTTIAKWCKDERFFTAEEAFDEGLADAIVADYKDLK